MTRSVHFALLTLLSLILSGCAFTYIPLVREPKVPEPRLYVSDSSELLQTEGSLALMLTIETVPEPDWLAVQWFNPANEEVYATSLWLEPAAKPQKVTSTLPARIALEDGLWRTVISYQGLLERQFSATLKVP